MQAIEGLRRGPDGFGIRGGASLCALGLVLGLVAPLATAAAAPSGPQLEGKDHAAAIRAALAADAELGNKRNHRPETAPLAVAVEEYVAGLDAIDFENTPDDFARAFRRHRDAWAEAIPWLAEHGEERGEMHDVFDRLRARGDRAARRLEVYEAAIWGTWRDVEQAARRHGALPPEELAAATAKSEPRPPLDLSRVELVDLSYAFDDDTLYWPTSPSAFELEVLHHGPSEGGFFYSANAFCTPEHGGTHLDAPIHFAEGRHTTDEIPLETLIGPAVVIDVAAHAARDADYRLRKEDVEAWEAEHGRVPAGAIVLLRTGWGERWPDRLRYLGDDAPGDASDLHFPSYGEAAARLLVEERGAAVLGVDTASIDHGPSTDFIVHQVAAAANVPGLENVAHLDQLPPTGAWVIALPVKIAHGSGGPVRIVALVPESTE